MKHFLITLPLVALCQGKGYKTKEDVEITLYRA